MIRITEQEYNAIHTDFRGVWDTERDDLQNWPDVRQQYIGKRTMMSRDGSCSLLIEGMHFEIVAECDMCATYGTPGYIVNAGQRIQCFQCNPTTATHEMRQRG